MTSERQPHILVVDDDPDVQELVRKLFQFAGFVHIPAQSARVGAQVLKQRPLPDCMVLDLMMPEVSGMEFLRQVRSHPEFDALPVVILSALADPDTIRSGLEQGADRYVTKVYLGGSLVKVVKEVLASGRRKSSA